MFSPQRVLQSTPKSENFRNKSVFVPESGTGTDLVHPRNLLASSKGKSVSFLDVENGAMERYSFNERLSSLENELLEYQHNMGLLLIEKNEWTLKSEELKHALAYATESLKREKAARARDISELENQDQNLRKALGFEKQRVLDLEKALRDMNSDYSEVKFNSSCKVAEANALITSVDEKASEVEAKFHAADAKLAEVNRKSSEIEMKLHEFVIQENALRRERESFNTEREARNSSMSKQKEDLIEWERKLKEAEERLAINRRMLNQREEKTNENDKLLKEKQSDLEGIRKTIEVTRSSLRIKEDDINRRVAELVLSEKEARDFSMILEEREKRVAEFEDKLNSREKMEMQKLLDEHKLHLDEKQKAYELEIENKTMMHEELLKNKLAEVERKEAEIAHMEEKQRKREESTEKKMETVKEKEADFDSKSKALKERESSLRNEMENSERQKQQIFAEKEEMLKVKAELEKLKTDAENRKLELQEERERLEITEEERNEHARLQSELKFEIERFRVQNEHFLAEANNLKLEKETFEKEWDELDDKRSEIRKELDEVLKQKIHLEKHRNSEEERLQMEKQETQLYVQRELEALQLAKREKSFEEQREMELGNINYLREVAKREMEEMQLERAKLEKERIEISQNRDHVEAQQREMKRDIEELVGLSQKLKCQREEFLTERERFTTFVDKQISCNECGEVIRKFLHSDLRHLTEPENIEIPSHPKLAGDYVKSTEVMRASSESSPKSRSPIASGTVSWFRRCTSKILKLSPGMWPDLDTTEGFIGEEASQTAEKGSDSPTALTYSEREPKTFIQGAGYAPSFSHDPLSIPRNFGMKIGSKKTFDNGEDSVHTNDQSLVESHPFATTENRRKRNQPDSQAMNEDQTGGKSDSVMDSGRPKRRQRVAEAESVSQKRYNLRERRKPVATPTNAVSSQERKGKGKSQGRRNNQLLEAGAVKSRKLEFGSTATDTGNNAAASEFSTDSPHVELTYTGSTQSDDRVHTENTSAGNRVLSEEMNEAAQVARKNELENERGTDDEADYGGEAASVSKRILNFLLT